MYPVRECPLYRRWIWLALLATAGGLAALNARPAAGQIPSAGVQRLPPAPRDDAAPIRLSTQRLPPPEIAADDSPASDDDLLVPREPKPVIRPPAPPSAVPPPSPQSERLPPPPPAIPAPERLPPPPGPPDDLTLGSPTTSAGPGAIGREARLSPFTSEDFAPDPIYPSAGQSSASLLYRNKRPVPVQRPWVELGRGFYLPGQYPPARDFLGPTNLVMPHFLVYGDWRTVAAANTSNDVRTDEVATKMQLETDYKLTATERFHVLFTPLNRLGNVTRVQRVNNGPTQFFEGFNAKPTTAFFEGDLGSITGGLTGVDSPFDLPFTFGLIPLFFQNGIWMNDPILGFAFNIPAKNSPRLDWANYEVTFFAGFDDVTTDAFKAANDAADVFGAAAFIEAYGGYIETGYSFLYDKKNIGRSYNNATAAFTKRYFGRVSNSMRGIVNFGQNGAVAPLTADGVLLLAENSLITTEPSNVVPYFNFFAGFGSPQSVARQAAAGGVLSNTGISYEIDNITNYPTLNAAAHNTCGGAIGVNVMGEQFLNQLILEGAYVHPFGNQQQSLVLGDQYAVSGRYQRALTKSLILRMDIIYGVLLNAPDISGFRVELRHKF